MLFEQRCAGCHTLSAAGTHGSAANIRTAERNDGPNFNVRCETDQRVLYAIRNGGFSGAIMPQNIVVGADADDVARSSPSTPARRPAQRAVAGRQRQQAGHGPTPRRSRRPAAPAHLRGS